MFLQVSESLTKDSPSRFTESLCTFSDHIYVEKLVDILAPLHNKPHMYIAISVFTNP